MDNLNDLRLKHLATVNDMNKQIAELHKTIEKLEE